MFIEFGNGAQMTTSKRSGIFWFSLGVATALFVLLIMKWRDVPGIIESDSIATLVLGTLATVQFGLVMPITCIVIRYRSGAYNFFNALLLLLGFTLAVGAIVTWSGAYFLALLYVLITSGILSALYLLTCALHNRMHEPTTKNRP
jgi:hypothetical protein